MNEKRIPHMILHCLAAVDPEPVEMMSIFFRLQKNGVTDDLVMFAVGISFLEESRFVVRVTDTEEKIELGLTEAGRREAESLLPSGMTLAKMRTMVREALREVTGQKVPKVC